MKYEPGLPEPLAARLRAARRWFVLTGAGISAESGVPTFRGAGGLWEGFRPEELASADGFRRDPARVWRWYRWRRGIVARAEPNAGHRALVSLERQVEHFSLATQNVDGLHERAGNCNVLALHGSIMRARCFAGCLAAAQDEEAQPVPRCICGSPLRPDVVWFGETLPGELLEQATVEAGHCEVCLVVGTSAFVHPAAGLPIAARLAGAILVEVNLEETPLSPVCDAVLHGPAAIVLPDLLRCLGLLREPLPGSGV